MNEQDIAQRGLDKAYFKMANIEDLSKLLNVYKSTVASKSGTEHLRYTVDLMSAILSKEGYKNNPKTYEDVITQTLTNIANNKDMLALVAKGNNAEIIRSVLSQIKDSNPQFNDVIDKALTGLKNQAEELTVKDVKKPDVPKQQVVSADSFPEQKTPTVAAATTTPVTPKASLVTTPKYTIKPKQDNASLDASIDLLLRQQQLGTHPPKKSNESAPQAATKQSKGLSILDRAQLKLGIKRQDAAPANSPETRKPK